MWKTLAASLINTLSFWGEACAYNVPSLILPHASVTSQGSERSYMCVSRGVSGHTCVYPGEWVVIHLCIQGSERSYMCVFRGERSYMCVSRGVSGHTCVYPGEWAVIHVCIQGSERSYMCVSRGVSGHTCVYPGDGVALDFELFWWCVIRFLNCSDRVAFDFWTVLMVWHYIFELFWWCGIRFLNCSDGVALDFSWSESKQINNRFLKNNNQL